MPKKKERVPLSPDDQLFIEELYQNHYKTMYYHTMAATQDEQIAEDLMQEAWLNLIKQIPTLRKLSRSKIDAYIYVTIRRLCVRYIKKEKKLKCVSISQPSVSETVEEKAANTAQEKEESRQDLNAILDQLSERDRFILQSRYIIGMTDEELGAVLDCSPDSIRALACRARQRARAAGLIEEKGVETEIG